MVKKSKILTLLFLLTVIGSIIATYHRYIIRGDISYELDEETFQTSLLEE